MSARVRIAVVDDHQPDNETHAATTAAIEHAATTLGVAAEAAWTPTESVLADLGALADVDGLWIAPGSPYRSLEGALAAIRLARTQAIPLLGTCAGFQHIVVEHARGVIGVAGAGHAECDAGRGPLFVTPLSCSLVGRTFTVRLTPGTRAADAYGGREPAERYYCNFGLNPEHRGALEAAGLVVSGVDGDGEARIVELAGHPFFVGTHFVPQVASSPARPHPLVTAFLRACVRRAGGPGATAPRRRAGPAPAATSADPGPAAT